MIGYSVFRSLTFSLVNSTSTNDIPQHMRQKNYGLHTITRVHNIVRVNCQTCTYFFPKQTAGSTYLNVSISKTPLIQYVNSQL